jgi:16S rRNA G527 N7-methylase RsmG
MPPEQLQIDGTTFRAFFDLNQIQEWTKSSILTGNANAIV